MGTKKQHELVQICTQREKEFVDKYIQLNYNARQAALAIGIKETTTAHWSFKTLQKPCVKAYLAQAKAQLFSTVDASTERIMQELVKIAFSDVRMLYDDAGRMLRPHELEGVIAGAIGQIESTELIGREDGQTTVVGFSKKVRMHDKLRALEMLARLAGLDVGDVRTQQISVNIKQPDTTEE